MDYLDPPRAVTCWFTLDDTHRDAGTLEYIPGSHKWPLAPIPEDFHAPDDHRGQMRYAAEAAGISAPEPRFIEVPAGSCVHPCRRDLAWLGPERDGRPDAALNRRAHGAAARHLLRPAGRLCLSPLLTDRRPATQRKLLPGPVAPRRRTDGLDRGLLRDRTAPQPDAGRRLTERGPHRRLRPHPTAVF